MVRCFTSPLILRVMSPTNLSTSHTVLSGVYCARQPCLAFRSGCVPRPAVRLGPTGPAQAYLRLARLWLGHISFSSFAVGSKPTATHPHHSRHYCDSLPLPKKEGTLQVQVRACAWSPALHPCLPLGARLIPSIRRGCLLGSGAGRLLSPLALGPSRRAALAAPS